MYNINLEKSYQSVGEVEFVQGLSAASASGIYGSSRAAAAIIGHANLNLGSKVKPILESLVAASPNRFRGIRHIVAKDDDPKVVMRQVYDLKEQMNTKNFIEGAKVLANMGYGSRREIESWIFDGRIKLNNSLAKVGDRVSNKDLIYLDGNKIETAKIFRTRVVVYNKPEGEISSNDDPKCRPTVFDNLPSLKRAKWISVGRLDINTTGLLLFTTNGELANRLMHPRYQVERKYLVRVFGDVNQSDIDILKKGVLLDDEQAKFKTIERNKGASDGEKRLNNWFKVTLEGGKNREVRRLWESQGFEISRLKRIAYGPIDLQPFIRPGNYLELSIEEVQKLGASVNLAISFRGMRDERGNQARDEKKLRSRGTRSRKR